jgi:hypothetical protein
MVKVRIDHVERGHNFVLLAVSPAVEGEDAPMFVQLRFAS